jgi:hypothetical protein
VIDTVQADSKSLHRVLWPGSSRSIGYLRRCIISGHVSNYPPETP